ncbi:MAG: CPBP family intramembrane metalloprotease [Lachnospiraceae bacterium]|nr:CPBP family intramembrane metalloprotease [Lachnospiraceae bacterium]
MERRVREVNVIFLVTIAFYILGSLLLGDVMEKSSIVALLISQGVLVLPSVIWMCVRKVKFNEVVTFKKIDFITVLLVIGFVIAINPLLNFLNAMSMVVFSNQIGGTMVEITEETGFLGGLAVMALVPACLEEFVYRGVFSENYKKVNVMYGALLSGLLFGLLHMNFNQFSYAFVLGFAFSILNVASGSIITSMIAHFLINGTSVVLIYLMDWVFDNIDLLTSDLGDSIKMSLFGTTNLSGMDLSSLLAEASQSSLTVSSVIMSYGIQAVAGAVIAILIVKYMAKRKGNAEKLEKAFKDDRDKNLVTGEKLRAGHLIDIFLIVSMIICVVFMILIEITPYIMS